MDDSSAEQQEAKISVMFKEFYQSLDYAQRALSPALQKPLQKTQFATL